MEQLRLVSPVEAASLLGVSAHTLAVWRCAKRYALPYIKVGTRVMYRPCDIEQFIEAQRHVSAAHVDVRGRARPVRS